MTGRGADATERRRKAIGARLRQARKEKRLSQETVAQKLGWTRLTIIKHEEGAYEITDDKLSRYAEVYGKTLHWLRYGPAMADDVESTGVGDIPSELPNAVRVWIYEFLTELVRGGSTDQEVQKARALLTGPAVVGYLNDPTPGALQLTDDEMINALEQVGKHVIRRVLRKRGRKV
jgi:transcriptional regulator with XRE-family HTH domain